MTVEFVTARYLEMAAAYPGLVTFSRPIERRAYDCAPIEELLRAAFPEASHAVYRRTRIKELLRAAFPAAP